MSHAHGERGVHWHRLYTGPLRTCGHRTPAPCPVTSFGYVLQTARTPDIGVFSVYRATWPGLLWRASGPRQPMLWVTLTLPLPLPLRWLELWMHAMPLLQIPTSLLTLLSRLMNMMSLLVIRRICCHPTTLLRGSHIYPRDHPRRGLLLMARPCECAVLLHLLV